MPVLNGVCADEQAGRRSPAKQRRSVQRVDATATRLGSGLTSRHGEGHAETSGVAISWYVYHMSSGAVTRGRGGTPPSVERRGRRSMSGSGDSPQIRVRVPLQLRDRAEARARRERTTVSEIAREALEQALR